MSLVERLAPDTQRSLERSFLTRLADSIAPTEHVHEMKRYADDPLGFFANVLNLSRKRFVWSELDEYREHKWDGTPDPYSTALINIIGNKNVGIEAATGVGKTFFLAATVLWFLSCFEDSIVVTVAPKQPQLKLHLWKEISRLWEKFEKAHPFARFNELFIRMKPDSESWYAVGFTSGVGASEVSATKAQGFHAEHLLVIFEETPGINSAVMNAFDNTCTAPHNLRIAVGNPDHQQDELHRFCTTAGFSHIRISGYDHPNVVLDNPNFIPGAITKMKLNERLKRLGEDNPLYLSRCRGICPAEADDALIRLEWCYAARERRNDQAAYDRLIIGPRARGIDVANSENGDKAAVACGVGGVLESVIDFQCPDANELGRKQAVEARETNTAAQHIGIDSVGVGAGCVNEMIAQGLHVLSLNGGAAAAQRHGFEEKFVNLRSQMWWQMRIDLQAGNVILPDDEDLFADLVSPRWGTRNGRIFIQAKEEMRSKLGRSPNKGDAAIYWNWARQVPERVVAGVAAQSADQRRASSTRWKPPKNRVWK